MLALRKRQQREVGLFVRAEYGIDLVKDTQSCHNNRGAKELFDIGYILGKGTTLRPSYALCTSGHRFMRSHEAKQSSVLGNSAHDDYENAEVNGATSL